MLTMHTVSVTHIMGCAPRSGILDPVRLRSDGAPFRDQSDSGGCMHVHVHGQWAVAGRHEKIVVLRI
jgi:hypothetical protein